MIDWDLLEPVETEEDISLAIEADAAKAYLRDTDWYAVRFMETQVPIPQDVSVKRAEARDKISAAQN